MKTIYLDYAAATPLDPRVSAVMEPYFSAKFYNPSATYLAAKSVRQDIQASRESVAAVLGARPAEIIFTAGGTEANNLAIHGVMRHYAGSSMVISAIEHESVIKPAEGYECRQVAVHPNGLIDLSALEKAVDDTTVLISIIYANNEIGTIQPLRQAAQFIGSVKESRRRRGLSRPVYLHTDACQAGAYLDLHVSRLGVDLMTLNGGKIYGPKQSGVLFVKTGVALEPLVMGGGQERGLRSGTENAANIIGLAKALELAQSGRLGESERLNGLQELFITTLRARLPGAVINGLLKHRLPNNLHVTFPGEDNERLMMALDERGVQCAVGSACSAGNDEPSHVLKAIGLGDDEARASLRFSMGRGTTKPEVTKTIKILGDLIS